MEELDKFRNLTPIQQDPKAWLNIIKRLDVENLEYVFFFSQNHTRSLIEKLLKTKTIRFITGIHFHRNISTKFSGLTSSSLQIPKLSLQLSWPKDGASMKPFAMQPILCSFTVQKLMRPHCIRDLSQHCLSNFNTISI